jgi:hypothetical protein
VDSLIHKVNSSKSKNCSGPALVILIVNPPVYWFENNLKLLDENLPKNVLIQLFVIIRASNKYQLAPSAVV